MNQTMAKISYFGWKASSVSVRTTDHLSGLSGMSTTTVKLSQAVIVVSASCSELKMCAFFHALYLCVSSILTANSEYLRDINNGQVLVMDTENKIFNTGSLSRANKDGIACAQSTLRFYCLACRLFTGVTSRDCFA
jgi:hypothetical protein